MFPNDYQTRPVSILECSKGMGLTRVFYVQELLLEESKLTEMMIISNVKQKITSFFVQKCCDFQARSLLGATGSETERLLLFLFHHFSYEL